MTQVAAKPADLTHPEPVRVPTRAGNPNPLSSLQTPPGGGVQVNHIDLSGPAGPTLAASLGRLVPSGVPVRPFDSFTAPTRYGQGGAAA